jgi:hypothetical protein
MGARQKLNGSYFLSSLVLASLVGGLTESWLILMLALLVLLGVSVNNGDIRLGK